MSKQRSRIDGSSRPFFLLTVLKGLGFVYVVSKTMVMNYLCTLSSKVDGYIGVQQERANVSGGKGQWFSRKGPMVQEERVNTYMDNCR